MSKLRLTILSKIIEQEELEKLGQQVEGEPVVDTVAADKLADDIFNQLFDQTMDEAGLKKLLG
jgi:hypothetical protein